ncbi:MAG: ketoacyl-ACP synthase III [Bacteroidales bacterium]|nr:ketoacyl-ACP synthase III [Bacteroidales bacterium]
MNIEYYLPTNSITNQDLAILFPDWDYNSFEQKIGIKKRHIAGKNETALDLAEKSAKLLIDKIDKKSIDFLILCTQSPDYLLPTSACILQDRLNLPTSCGAIDINLGCSGYIYGLAIAKGLFESKIASNILFVVAETYSKHIHLKDKINRAIFGDASAATLINNEFQIGEFVLGTNGNGFDELIIKNSGMRNINEPCLDEFEYSKGNITSDSHLYMNGPEIFNFSVTTIPDLVLETAKKNNIPIQNIDYFVFHQANEFMLEYLRIKIGIPTDKFCIDIANTGNTVSATIPIALKNAYCNKKIKKGSKIMLVGFGVGLSWGATIITL